MKFFLLRYTKCYTNFDSNLSLCKQECLHVSFGLKRQANDKNQQKSYSYHLNQTGDTGPCYLFDKKATHAVWNACALNASLTLWLSVFPCKCASEDILKLQTRNTVVYFLACFWPVARIDKFLSTKWLLLIWTYRCISCIILKQTCAYINKPQLPP